MTAPQDEPRLQFLARVIQIEPQRQRKEIRETPVSLVSLKPETLFHTGNAAGEPTP